MWRTWCTLGAALVAGGCAEKSEVPRGAAATTSASAAPSPSAAPAASAAASAAAGGLPPGAGEPAAPLVALNGQSRPAAVAVVAPGAPRVYARALRAWIYAEPRFGSPRLGYLRAGASSPTAAEPVSRAGCSGGWHSVVPRGFVCVGRTATLDANDPVVRATVEYPPDHARRLPYIYGTVRRPGPVYTRLPGAEELARTEPDLVERMQTWLDAPGEIGASYAQHVWLGGMGDLVEPALAWRERRSDVLPQLLARGAELPILAREEGTEELVLEQMKPRVGYSFLRTVLHEGRRYGLSTDLKVIPTDRLRPIQGSDFHGVLIGEDIELPFAFVRAPSARLWSYEPRTGKLSDAGPAPYRGAIKLTGKQKFFAKRLHFETVEGHWLSDRDASRLDPARRMPAWGKRGEKWIDVNLTKQTLMLYEGTRPVFATLLSSGEAGLEDHEHSTATKRGIFRIHTKHVSATMSSDEAGEEFELRDVPYVQYFDQQGYALHGAYWHDRFGIPKSHGCLNLSPEDARRVFHWTEPTLPVGWHGVLSPLHGTVLFVHP